MVALVLAFNPGDHRSPLPLSGVVVDAHIDPGMRISPRGDVGIPPYTRTIMFLCFNLNLNLNLRRLCRTFPIMRHIFLYFLGNYQKYTKKNVSFTTHSFLYDFIKDSIYSTLDIFAPKALSLFSISTYPLST